jgi:hypothetical protein
MATTTPNYGWSVPTSTDLVKDGATAIETLGDSVDTTVKALNPETTLGDIAYRSATANTNTRLAIGSTSQILTVVGGVPAWATPAGGGKVLQVVYGSSNTSTAITTTTYTDTTLSASITPSSASSKVLIFVAQISKVTRGALGGFGAIRLLRDSTSILEPSATKEEQFGCTIFGATDSILLQGVIPMNYLDTPSTTSAITYKTQGACFATSGSCTFTNQVNSSISTIILMEIGA